MTVRGAVSSFTRYARVLGLEIFSYLFESFLESLFESFYRAFTGPIPSRYCAFTSLTLFNLKAFESPKHFSSTRHKNLGFSDLLPELFQSFFGALSRTFSWASIGRLQAISRSFFGVFCRGFFAFFSLFLKKFSAFSKAFFIAFIGAYHCFWEWDYKAYKYMKLCKNVRNSNVAVFGHFHLFKRYRAFKNFEILP